MKNIKIVTLLGCFGFIGAEVQGTVISESESYRTVTEKDASGNIKSKTEGSEYKYNNVEPFTVSFEYDGENPENCYLTSLTFTINDQSLLNIDEGTIDKIKDSVKKTVPNNIDTSPENVKKVSLGAGTPKIYFGDKANKQSIANWFKQNLYPNIEEVIFIDSDSKSEGIIWQQEQSDDQK